MGTAPSVEFASIAWHSKADEKQEAEEKAIAFYRSKNAIFHQNHPSTEDLEGKTPPIDISDESFHNWDPTNGLVSVLKHLPEADDLLKEILSPAKTKKMRKIQLDAIFKRNHGIMQDTKHPQRISAIEFLLSRYAFVTGKSCNVLPRAKILLECVGRDEEGLKRLREHADSNTASGSISSLLFEYHPLDFDLFRLLIIDYDGFKQDNQILDSIVDPKRDYVYEESHCNPEFDKIRSAMLREFISSGKVTEEMKAGVPSTMGMTPLMTAASLGLVECVNELIVNRIGGVTEWQKFRVVPASVDYFERDKFKELKKQDYNEWFASTHSVIQLACCADFSQGNDLVKKHTLRDHPESVASFKRRTKEIVQILLTLPGVKEEAFQKKIFGKDCIDLARESGNEAVVEVLMANKS